MTGSLSTYARQGKQLIRTYLQDPRCLAFGRSAGFVLGGLLLSAASLRNTPQPLVLGLVCASSGWEAALLGLGGALGKSIKDFKSAVKDDETAKEANKDEKQQ